MSFLPDLTSRYSGVEKMDDPKFSGPELSRVLKHLKTINGLLGNHRNMLKAILQTLPPKTLPMHIVDVGCGGGDLIFYLQKELKKRGYQVSFTGIDFNPNMDFGANDNVQFMVADVLSPNFIAPKCNFLISSHFIYRFSDSELLEFVKTNKRSVSNYIIFSELRRSAVAYVAFSAISRLFFGSPITLHDGQIAIKSSFTINELKSIFKEFGNNINVYSSPIYRLLVQIKLRED